MIPLTLAEVADLAGADLVGADPEARVTGSVEFDSRRVARGGLFVAFPGEKVDGHDYAGVAMAAGAVAVLGSRPVQGVPMLVVPDALTALGRLARAVRDRLPRLTVVGITGSSGKTTTKDLVAQVLAHLGEVVAPAGNFNNELGLPHTVLKATPGTWCWRWALAGSATSATCATSPARTSAWSSTSARRT
jgi:UDP-N-acetylmuramoyl-tripeptide--D-alanyl-D-alanine ligase